MTNKQKGILFVREGAVKTRGASTSECEGVLSTVKGTLSGQEAKTFYEDVISTPEESSVPVRRKRSRSKKRNKANKHPKLDRFPAKSVSVSQVFAFVQEGDLEGVKFSTSTGACDVNTKDQFQWSLLMSAAHAGHRHIVEHLLSEGVEWRGHTDRAGRDAVDLARREGHLSIACFIEAHKDTPPKREDSKQPRENVRFKSPHSKPRSFFCEICKQTVVESVTEERHATSTVHQFSCQHRSNPHTSYGIPQSNPGYQIMLRSGWNPEKGLGCEQEGRKYPIKTILKRDRLGFGQSEDESTQRKARVTHFAAFDERAVKRQSERFKVVKKKDILQAAYKDREWEMRMRRYMNTDHDIS